MAMGTSVGTITVLTPIAYEVARGGNLLMPLCIGVVVGGAMFGNGGMILFMILGCLLMVLVAVVMNHPELTQGLM